VEFGMVVRLLGSMPRLTCGPVRYATVMLLCASAAYGQDPTLHPEIEQVRDYAPIVWLADAEPFYPTLPHPYAFDGQDNDGDRQVDLNDLDEIALAFRLPAKQQRLVDLEDNFRRRLPEPRIIYALQRDVYERQQRPLIVVEFWLYYVADVGTGSHEGDSEHAFLFIDKESTSPGLLQRGVMQSGPVRAVVGAGHTGDTANNILATGSLSSPTGVMPARLPRHMPLLVELGKHATAPDLTMDGRFNVGIDSNVFRQAAWGSRDAFGLDLFELFAGYREAYSLPRNTSGIILEREALSARRLDEYRREFPHQFTTVEQFENNQKYRFLPLDDLHEIFRILEGAAGRDDGDARAALARHLEKHKLCFWPDGGAPLGDGEGAPIELDVHQFGAFLSWLDLGRDHVEIWTKNDHLKPGDIFKTYLYPRIELGFSRLWTQDAPMGAVLGGTVRVAEFSLRGRPALNDSSLELYANVQQKPLALYDFGLTYRYFRGGFGGPYFGIGWRREVRRGTSDLGEEERARLTRDFGDAAMAVVPVRERHTGLDLGYALSFNLARVGRPLRRMAVGLMVGARSELFADPLSPIEDAMNPGLPRRTRFQAKVTFQVGVLGPKHPLDR
jgi:hypothetical protein